MASAAVIQQQQQAQPATATSTTTFDSGHTDAVHDAQLDYYGRRLATASSDRTVKVFEVAGDAHVQIAELRGHEGPVWAVAWAHPKFGQLLASCSFDHRVIVWKEGTAGDGQWQQVYVSPSSLHTGSVNAVAWAPHEVGLVLAAASSDGTVSVIEYNTSTGTWDATKLPGSHAIGATAVSWAPPVPAGALLSGAGAPASGPVRRLVSAGCDNAVRIWRCSDPSTGMAVVWEAEEALLGGHTDWVRDVAWAPAPAGGGPLRATIVSAGQDGQVLAWTERQQGGGGAGGWDKRLIHDFRVPVWRVAWSVSGGLLAVSDANNAVTLWREAVDGVWHQVQH